jgi:hypothetical protein
MDDRRLAKPRIAHLFIKTEREESCRFLSPVGRVAEPGSSTGFDQLGERKERNRVAVRFWIPRFLCADALLGVA